jgi:NAD(P)-dependent dehydrogenase (short-subunit alcohol dehydrogenase family)
MSGKLSNKVALITGSSRGIGRAAALAFAKEGAAFVGVHYGSNAGAAQATVREIEALGAKAVADHIRDNGRIINISTGFTRVAAPTHPAYAASKGALETLTLALAPEFGVRGITVNTVMPGVTETDMNAAWIAIPEARAGAEALSVFSRVGQPADVADVIAFVASSEARWTTGQVIDATGGARL